MLKGKCVVTKSLISGVMDGQAGAPSYPVLTGRNDGITSTAASVDLPSPSISWEAALAYFKSKGLDVLDMATLLGKATRP